MHLHILGICGTFMGGIALLARALGHRVTGSDANVYPPMSTQLEAAGIALTEGYGAEQLDPTPDVVVVGCRFELVRPITLHQLDPRRLELGAHGGVDVGVGSGDLVAQCARQERDAAHEGPADTEDVQVHLRPP